MTSKLNAELPFEIYSAFVESLYKDKITLAMGIAAQALLAVMVYWKTGSTAYLMVAGMIAFAGVVRIAQITRFENRPPPSNQAEAKAAERAYVVTGAFHAASLGAFCLTGIYFAHDPFGEIASVAVTVASASSIAGRNYGSPRMVMILVVAATFPISVGFILRGDFYHVLLGLLSIPFFIAIRRFAATVRGVLMNALSQERMAKRLAQVFDRALNTMPNGLIMFDRDGRAVVANREAATLLSFPSSDALMGRTLKALLNRCVAARLLQPGECDHALAQLTRAMGAGEDSKVLVSFENGRYFEFSGRGGEENLGVVTFEEVTARIEAERQIKHMARFDSLTGLPNRSHFRDLVEQRLAEGDPSRMIALLILDIDDFKQVNDAFGHPVGDGLIYEVSARLKRFAGARIDVSRFGGDEFLVFIDEAGDERELARIIDKVFASFDQPVELAGHTLRVNSSGGAAVSLAFAADVDALIVKADIALYKVKGSGKNGWLFFAQEMDTAFRERQMMKAELRRAIDQQQLRAVYQPIVELSSMRIATCEALARWTHPELGEVSPAIFIPIAEEMGIVSQITAQMLKVACRECAKWPSGVSVSVNISAIDFRDRDIVETIRKALTVSGLPASRLEIEVTETALLNDQSLTRSILEDIKAMGVRIALDDFGTGYSNLSYVHSLPLDKLKIDQSFLNDIDTSKRTLDLLKATVRLAREIGLDVTVEGAETLEHLGVLTDTIRPDYVQGFVFGPPLPSSAIATIAGKQLSGQAADPLPKTLRHA
ncbi:MAG: EAL domain-containing protein [Rhizobiaceae bacterium]